MAALIVARNVPLQTDVALLETALTEWLGSDLPFVSWMPPVVKDTYTSTIAFFCFESLDTATTAYDVLVDQPRLFSDTLLRFDEPVLRQSPLRHSDRALLEQKRQKITDFVQVTICRPQPTYKHTEPFECLTVPFQTTGSLFWLDYWEHEADITAAFSTQFGVRMLRTLVPNRVVLTGPRENLTRAVVGSTAIFIQHMYTQTYQLGPAETCDWMKNPTVPLLFHNVLPVATIALNNKVTFFSFSENVISTCLDLFIESLYVLV